MSIKENIRQMTQNPFFAASQEDNRQLYIIKSGDSYISVVQTDSGEFLQYNCLPEYWEYGETVAESALEPLALGEESGYFPQLLSITETLNQNGFAPVCIYPDPQGEQDAILVCTLTEPHIYLIMADYFVAYLNERSLSTLPEEFREPNSVLTRYHIEVQEDGTITRI